MDDKPERPFGLWHLALNVRNLEKMETFYVQVMGMNLEWRPDQKNVYLSSGRDNLALHAVPDLPLPGAKGVLDHLGFFVSTPEAVDHWHAYLVKSLGSTDTAPMTHRDGARSFYFRDPEENRIQILCHPPIVRAMKGTDAKTG